MTQRSYIARGRCRGTLWREDSDEDNYGEESLLNIGEKILQRTCRSTSVETQGEENLVGMFYCKKTLKTSMERLEEVPINNIQRDKVFTDVI